jgi:hypothetical protein
VIDGCDFIDTLVYGFPGNVFHHDFGLCTGLQKPDAQTKKSTGYKSEDQEEVFLISGIYIIRQAEKDDHYAHEHGRFCVPDKLLFSFIWLIDGLDKLLQEL